MTDGANNQTVTVTGRAMTLSEETSRACGYLAEIDGETPNEPTARAARNQVRRDAQILADRLGKSIEISASHPSCQSWVVDVIEPGLATNEAQS